MKKIERIILWVLGISLLAYFLFLPFDIYRKRPEKISPQMPSIPIPQPGEITTSTETSTELNY